MGPERLRSRAPVTDLLEEAVSGALARPLRAAFTVLGSAIGIAALLATLGITQTAAAQLMARFDEVAASEVVVGPSDNATDAEAGEALPFTPERELTRLRGVVAAGSVSRVDVRGALIGSLPSGAGAAAPDRAELPVYAASPGLISAVRGELSHGRSFDPVHDERQERVVVLGASAADRLHISRVDQQPAIHIGDEPYSVIGILDDVARESDLLGGVIMPEGTAAGRFGLSAPDRVVIETDMGAARMIGEQAPMALAPAEPSALTAEIPPDLTSLREGAEQDVNALYLLLGIVSLVVGALGITNITLVSVMERTGEIGLRRALGATRRHVVGQFLIESGLLGLVGGLVGSAAGVTTVVVTALARSWAPVLNVQLLLVGPLVGLAVGLLAGAYPAWRAGSVEPVDGLRSGV